MRGGRGIKRDGPFSSLELRNREERLAGSVLLAISLGTSRIASSPFLVGGLKSISLWAVSPTFVNSRANFEPYVSAYISLPRNGAVIPRWNGLSRRRVLRPSLNLERACRFFSLVRLVMGTLNATVWNVQCGLRVLKITVNICSAQARLFHGSKSWLSAKSEWS